MITHYDSDGVAWWKPDAIINTEKYYSIDWSEWLTAEGDTLDGDAVWTVPDGLTNMDEQNLSPLTSIKLRANTVGTYVITCSIPSTDGTLTQKMIQRINLIVK